MSSVKRSRIMRSPSLADAILDRPSSPATTGPQEIRCHGRTILPFFGNTGSNRTTPRSDPSQFRTSILSLSMMPVNGETCEEKQNGHFLEKCHYCRKMIREHDEVFMYGHLRAFCSTDCREKQITKDALREKTSGWSKKRSTESS